MQLLPLLCLVNEWGPSSAGNSIVVRLQDVHEHIRSRTNGFYLAVDISKKKKLGYEEGKHALLGNLLGSQS